MNLQSLEPIGSFVRTKRPETPGLLVADLHESPLDPQVRHRYAYLFAAAPDLFDALERLVYLAELEQVPGPGTLQQARAALARALGGEVPDA